MYFFGRNSFVNTQRLAKPVAHFAMPCAVTKHTLGNSSKLVHILLHFFWASNTAKYFFENSHSKNIYFLCFQCENCTARPCQARACLRPRLTGSRVAWHTLSSNGTRHGLNQIRKTTGQTTWYYSWRWTRWRMSTIILTVHWLKLREMLQLVFVWTLKSYRIDDVNITT